MIDGELSDEVGYFPQLQRAIEKVLDRSCTASKISERREGDDPHQVKVIRDFVGRSPKSVKRGQFTVTGAWYEPAGAPGKHPTGCVASVHLELERLGCASAISPSAVVLDVNQEVSVTEPARRPTSS